MGASGGCAFQKIKFNLSRRMKPSLIKNNSFLMLSLLFLFSCGPGNPVIDEEDDPAFERGRSYLKVGKETEALDEFLSVTRRMIECPKSHLESGRLLLSLKERKDPIASIYHFRRFLLLKPESREAPKIKQLIVSAEREIIRNLPGKPYGDYLDLIALQEENTKLQRQIVDYQARLGRPLPEETLPQRLVPSPPSSPRTLPSPPGQVKSYVVKKGDSLYAISRKFYGDSSKIDLIFQANRDNLPSKNSLKVGQTLLIPPASQGR